MQRSWYDSLPETHRQAIRSLFPDLRHLSIEDWHQAVMDYFATNFLSPMPSQTSVWRTFRSFERMERQREAYQIAGEVVAAGGIDELLEGSERTIAAELIFAVNELMASDLDPKDRMRAVKDAADAKNRLAQSRQREADLREKVLAKLEALESESKQKDSRKAIDPETLRIIREEIYGIVG